MHVKLYYGFGHTHDLILHGHLFRNKPRKRKIYSDNIILNTLHLLRLFFLRPVKNAEVKLHWQGMTFEQTTANDGYFRFEWSSPHSLHAGWYPVEVRFSKNGDTVTGTGELYVPHITQYGFISDIDDTVLVSHSAFILKRLKELLTSNPRTRDIFNDVARHYHLLATSNTSPEEPNPFFYVSSSEWNMYDYLVEFFRYNHMPKGAFLLNHVKRWYEFFQSGNTEHSGKLIRIVWILQAFPKQQFVLLGDNSQKDPLLYNSIARRYPDRIHAVYIRNARPGKEAESRNILAELQKDTGIHTCFFRNSDEAISHSKSIGLIS